MLLYVGIAIWPLFIQYLYKYRPLEIGDKMLKDNKYLIIALFPIFLILAFRNGNMGADTGTYVSHFLYMIDTPLEIVIKFSRMEVGYLIFVKLLTHITHNGLIYQIICISFMTVCMYIFLKQFKIEDALLYIFFYCTLGIFFFMFTGTRQCLAMSICLFSYQFLIKKKYLKFLKKHGKILL